MYFKCDDADPFVDAFGEPFAEYWNQPLGAARIGRLGMQAYREVRDVEQAVEVDSGEGDEAIVDAYDEYQADHRGRVVLYLQRPDVRRARSSPHPARAVGRPPARAPPEDRRLLAPGGDAAVRADRAVRRAGAARRHAARRSASGATPTSSDERSESDGVWRGKDGLDWREERLTVDCRSPTVEAGLERDLSIVEAHEELRVR